MSKLAIGDTVTWRGAWGNQEPKEAKVKSIEVCPNGSKYGDQVTSVDWDVVDRNVVISLTNGHWCYGTQITK